MLLWTAVVLFFFGFIDAKYLRTQCSEGYLSWDVDGTCHQPNSQGPCSYDLVLVDHNNCANIEDSSSDGNDIDDGVWSLGSIFHTKLVKKKGWLVPGNETYLDEDELNCLAAGQVYWPKDGQCYDLLSAGPCSRGEWLVLEADGRDDRVVCKTRTCPCDSVHPEYCEVEVRDGDCQCKVAMAAAQDGLCDVGEQLLLDPYGFGVCGCISSPPHITWPVDGKCYPLSTQGPCNETFQLAMSSTFGEPFCKPALCENERSVMWNDGACYDLGTRGPCDEIELLSIDEESLEPRCIVEESRVKRMFDTLPGGFIRDGPVSISLKARNCLLDRRGKCKNSFRSQNVSKKSSNKLRVRRRSSRSYINFLKQFRQ